MVIHLHFLASATHTFHSLILASFFFHLMGRVGLPVWVLHLLLRRRLPQLGTVRQIVGVGHDGVPSLALLAGGHSEVQQDRVGHQGGSNSKQCRPSQRDENRLGQVLATAVRVMSQAVTVTLLGVVVVVIVVIMGVLHWLGRTIV